MLFGVPDEITKMTRSLKMVERERFKYRTIVFGHWKCFGGCRVLIGSPERSFGHPGKDMVLMGQEREHMIGLQHIYNFLLFHVVILSILDVL